MFLRSSCLQGLTWKIVSWSTSTFTCSLENIKICKSIHSHLGWSIWALKKQYIEKYTEIAYKKGGQRNTLQT